MNIIIATKNEELNKKDSRLFATLQDLNYHYNVVKISDDSNHTDQLNNLLYNLLVSQAGIRRKIIFLEKMLKDFKNE